MQIILRWTMLEKKTTAKSMELRAKNACFNLEIDF